MRASRGWNVDDLDNDGLDEIALRQDGKNASSVRTRGGKRTIRIAKGEIARIVDEGHLLARGFGDVF